MPYHTHRATSRPGPCCLLSAGVGLAWSVVAASAARADYVYSGVVSIQIPTTDDGVFIDLNTGAFGSSRTAVAGWDLNIFGAGTLMLSGQGDVGFMASGGASGSLIDNLDFMAQIGESSSFSSGPMGVETTGSAAMNFNSSQNLIGFRFLDASTGGYHYGWMRLQLSDSSIGEPRAIFEYLWESTPGAWTSAGVIPAPGAIALLAGMPCGLAGRRRRRG